MSVHKFGIKPKKWQPKSIHWMPVEGLKYPPRKLSPTTWEIFNQIALTIRPDESKTIRLRFGVMMSSGMVLTTLKQSLKMKQCSAQNEVILENAEDVLINIRNNSNEIVTIEEGESLCFLHYT